jgi:hypothetical protein
MQGMGVQRMKLSSVGGQNSSLYKIRLSRDCIYKIRINRRDYSEQLKLYWKDDRVYDQLSAAHNGLIGSGSRLKEIIRSKR